MKLYSNEIVFRGHPDKVCDQIAAAILDAMRGQDPDTRAGIEVCGGKGKIFITGEVTTTAVIDVENVAKRVLGDIGYSTEYEIIDNIGVQSADIAQGVDIGGAGDQGMMFGYATSETEEMLPKAMVILQDFAMQYDELRKYDSWFLPDGKAQITGIYDDKFRLQKIKTFTISYQNTESKRDETDALLRHLARAIATQYGVVIDEFLINPTGRFEIGGFDGDAGAVNRKIVVDTYQSFANIGGGGLNGKDATKVDFSGAHKAREIAVRLLKENGLNWCEVQLSYAIGMAKPLAIYADSNKGYIEVPESIYDECVPQKMIGELGLKNMNYESLARYGHFVK